MQKRVLFGGGGHSELPMIEEAKKLGWYVITTGTNEDGLGHALADEYVYGNWSDKDFLLELAKEKKVDAIVSGCNDFSYIATAYVCEWLGLPGHDSYETAQIIHHKDKFRKLVESLGIRTPKMLEVASIKEIHDAIEKIGLPVVVKPTDLTGGKGVKICHDIEEIDDAFNDAISATRRNHILVEEFIDGKNAGACFILKNHKVVYSVFDDEQYYINKYLVEGANSPCRCLNNAGEYRLISDVEKISRHLNLVDGLFHLQFIADKNGNPVIIDPCRRAPGDLWILACKFVSGINYPLEVFKAEIGEEIDDHSQSAHSFIARQCIMTNRTGIIKSIFVDDYLKEHMIHELVWGKPGDYVDDFMKYKAGILITEYDDIDEIDYVTKRLHDLVKIEFEE